MMFHPTGMPANPPARRLISAATPPVVFLVYAALRWFLLGRIQAIWFSDTALYAAQYRQGFAGGFFGQGRPWGYPFFLWLTGYHWGLAIVVQRLVATLAWFALAQAATGLFRSDTARRIVFYGTLLVSLSLFVLSWDSMLLSESLSISLYVALTAAWFHCLGSETLRLGWLAGCLVLAVPLAGLRDAHAPMLLFFSAVVGVELVRRTFQDQIRLGNITPPDDSGTPVNDEGHGHSCKAGTQKLVRYLAGGLLVISGIIVCALLHHHDAQAGRRAWINIGNVLSCRAFAKEVGTNFFVPHPENIAWMERHYQLPADDATVRVGRLVTQDPPLSPRYRDWLIERGSRAWTGFLLRHPAWVWSAYTRLDPYVTFPTDYLKVEAQKWETARMRLPELIQRVIYGMQRVLVCGTSQIDALLALAALALGAAWAWSWFRRPRIVAAQTGALFWLVASSSLAALVAIIGDYIETWRHAIVGLVTFQAAFPLGAAIATEQIREWRTAKKLKPAPSAPTRRPAQEKTPPRRK